ncbi:hypothetical protein DPMN_171705 [Dreissena polymorpha]|uniref:Secreted protein n=1 Tax=Dreissena polymorpha TaxID=45954 RepID=A0A9D4IFU2_DREPO|nr:hypothetical protein DPMN_171705 [Dreissena polymorpha]
MNLCVKALLSVIYLLEFYHCIPLTSGLECPQCIHVGFKLINMPSEVSSIVDQMLGTILAQYSNPSCQGNTVAA